MSELELDQSNRPGCDTSTWLWGEKVARAETIKLVMSITGGVQRSIQQQQQQQWPCLSVLVLTDGPINHRTTTWLQWPREQPIWTDEWNKMPNICPKNILHIISAKTTVFCPRCGLRLGGGGLGMCYLHSSLVILPAIRFTAIWTKFRCRCSVNNKLRQGGRRCKS